MTAPVFDMFAPEMCVDPYPHYAAMRDVDPVHESALGFFMLFRHADVRSFFADKTLEHQYALTQQLRGGPESLEQPYYDVFRRMVFVMDNPDHRRVRLLFAKSFTPAQIKKLSKTSPRSPTSSSTQSPTRAAWTSSLTSPCRYRSG